MSYVLDLTMLIKYLEAVQTNSGPDLALQIFSSEGMGYALKPTYMDQNKLQ